MWFSLTPYSLVKELLRTQLAANLSQLFNYVISIDFYSAVKNLFYKVNYNPIHRHITE